MKKLYVKPQTGIGCAQFASSLLTTSNLEKGAVINSDSGTVEADARSGFWDETE